MFMLTYAKHYWYVDISPIQWIRSHMSTIMGMLPIPVTARSKARWDFGFESRRKNACLSLVNVVCFHREVSATG